MVDYRTRSYYEKYALDEYLEYFKEEQEYPEFARPSRRSSWIGLPVDAENGFVIDEPFNPPP